MTSDSNLLVLLSNIPDARVPPRLSPWWSRSCWTFFVVGALTTMVCLTALPWISEEARVAWAWPALGVAWVAFPSAAANTMLAATGFSKRKNALVKLIGEALRGMTEVREANPESKSAKEWTDDSGDFSVQAAGGWSTAFFHEPRWIISVRGDCQPAPYQQAGEKAETIFPFKQYIDLLEAEVHTARASAARLAAALGGLFVAALQVYSRLIG